jgi:predicted transcriptional regulator
MRSSAQRGLRGLSKRAFAMKGRVTRVVGQREAEILSILWREGPANVAEIKAKLTGALAYTTVLTILRNLYRKGMAGRRRVGRLDTYNAIVSLDVVRREAVQRIVETLFDGDPDALSKWLRTKAAHDLWPGGS